MFKFRGLFYQDETIKMGATKPVVVAKARQTSRYVVAPSHALWRPFFFVTILVKRTAGLLRAALLLLSIGIPAIAAPYGFGYAPSPQDIAIWDIDVRPDGRGLPAGRGTVAQGQLLYDARCANCHGTFGESNDYMPLAGGLGSLQSHAPVRTVGSKLSYPTTLWDYINRAMPFNAPQSLGPDEVYALTAYVLYLNDIVPADTVLDAGNLPKLVMPNHQGMTLRHGLMQVHGQPDTRNKACMKNCARKVGVISELPDHARDSHGELAQQFRGMGPYRGVVNGPHTAASHTTATLVEKYGCTACHAMQERRVGPAFHEVALRYRADTDARNKLIIKISKGGSGVWGDVAMPAQSLPDQDMREIVQWILQ